MHTVENRAHGRCTPASVGRALPQRLAIGAADRTEKSNGGYRAFGGGMYADFVIVVLNSGYEGVHEARAVGLGVFVARWFLWF